MEKLPKYPYNKGNTMCRRGTAMLQIAICDDEREDLLNMQRLAQEIIDSYAIRYNIQTFDTGEELLESPILFDLVFMDIKLNEENGIEIGKKLYWKNRSVKIIFETYYNEQCSNAVNRSHAFAFLTKPIDKPLLEKQLDEFLRTKDNMQDMWISFENIEWISETGKTSRKMVKLPIRDIIYFEAIKKDKIIKTVTDRGNFCFSGIIHELEEKMRPFGFETCSRGIVVNFDKIQKMEKGNIVMSNGERLPLSQRRNTIFRERMNEFFYNSMVKKNV